MFPRDHGPHPQFRSEWWYFTATLTDTAGQAYGAQFTLFRQALAPVTPQAGKNNPWQTKQLYLVGYQLMNRVLDGLLYLASAEYS